MGVKNVVQRRVKQSKRVEQELEKPFNVLVVMFQTLNMYAKLLCSFELPFVAKTITGRIHGEGLRWKISQFFML